MTTTFCCYERDFLFEENISSDVKTNQILIDDGEKELKKFLASVNMEGHIYDKFNESNNMEFVLGGFTYIPTTIHL